MMHVLFDPHSRAPAGVSALQVDPPEPAVPPLPAELPVVVEPVAVVLVVVTVVPPPPAPGSVAGASRPSAATKQLVTTASKLNEAKAWNRERNASNVKWRMTGFLSGR